MQSERQKTKRLDPVFSERGQILIMYALALPLLILFTAMAVDMGLIYVTKAKLSKAVDAACLTGVKNVGQGQATAGALATDMFDANFGPNPPTPVLTWTASTPTTPLLLKVQATATVNTFFMKYLPQWATWSLNDTAQATRSNLVMTIVLDESTSMSNDDGAAALQTAVPNFVADFIPGTDDLALVSFGSYSQINVNMTSTFQTAIGNAVKSMNGTMGGTFGTGGSYVANYGPPLALADNQNNSVVFPQETKIVVYFTDGLMNTIQDTLPCTNIGPTLYNYGGYDSGSDFDFFTPSNGNDLSTSYSGTASGKGTGTGCTTSKGTGLCSGNPPYSATARCAGVTQFFSQATGAMTNFSRAAITTEAQYRALAEATAMRSETPVATYIFTIGLGTGVTLSTQQFLQNLANDPSAPNYNPNLPVGLFEYVPDCPSPTCTADLNQAFQTIASKILLRLTQ